MTYTRFEELPVWQDAMTLAEAIFQLRLTGELRRQLCRAVLSISNNIAEGFERGTTKELITFLYIARGSASEVRSILLLIERLPAFRHLHAQVTQLKPVAESISRQLRAWAANLQDSPIRGQRYLGDAERAQQHPSPPP